MAATITTLYKSYVNGYEQGTISVSIPSADVLTLNSVPIEVLAARGAGKCIMLTEIVPKIDVYGGTPYATNTNLIFRYADTTSINAASGLLASVAAKAISPTSSVGMACAHSTPVTFVSNQGVQVTVASGNPTAGNSTVVIIFSYKVIPVTS